MPFIASICGEKSLDNSIQVFIIVFTGIFENTNAAVAQGHRQAKGFTATRHTQSPPSGCPTSSVPGQQFLRSGRPASGQVRDAPAGTCRSPADFPGGTRVRIFAALVLPSQRGLRAGWLDRSGSSETRSQKWPQTDPGSDGGRSSNANGGSVAQFRSVGSSCKGRLQHGGSPAQHRATVAAGKKTSLNSAPTPQTLPEHAETLLAGYEELRRRAMGGLCGAGLGVLMHLGMRAGMNAFSGSCASRPAKVCTRREQLLIPEGLQTEIVLILSGRGLRAQGAHT